VRAEQYYLVSMRSAVIFIFLEYLIGFGFAIAGIFIFSEYDRSSLMTSIFYGFVVGFFSMFVGIALVGYFHCRMMKILKKFVGALGLTLVGLFLSLLLYAMVEGFLPDYLGILAIIFPLTGGVIGFNWALKNN
jgi:hypothetical protein